MIPALQFTKVKKTKEILMSMIESMIEKLFLARQSSAFHDTFENPFGNWYEWTPELSDEETSSLTGGLMPGLYGGLDNLKTRMQLSSEARSLFYAPMVEMFRAFSNYLISSLYYQDRTGSFKFMPFCPAVDENIASSVQYGQDYYDSYQLIRDLIADGNDKTRLWTHDSTMMDKSVLSDPLHMPLSVSLSDLSDLSVLSDLSQDLKRPFLNWLENVIVPTDNDPERQERDISTYLKSCK